MATGLEHIREEGLRTLVGNLKSGAFLAIKHTDSAAFELDMALLSIFEREFLQRGLDFDSLIGDELRAIINNWKSEREQ